MREPALGAGHQPPRDLGPEVKREAPGKHLICTVRLCPWQLQISRADFSRRWMKTHGRQRGSRGDLAWPDQLLDLEQFDVLFPRGCVGNNRVAGSEVNADDVILIHAREMG